MARIAAAEVLTADPVVPRRTAMSRTFQLRKSRRIGIASGSLKSRSGEGYHVETIGRNARCDKRIQREPPMTARVWPISHVRLSRYQRREFVLKPPVLAWLLSKTLKML